MAKVSAIVLAAGLSRRMGAEDKLFLPLKGKPIISWAIEKISESMANEIILVGSPKNLKRLEHWKSDRIQLVENPHYQTGMTSSIQAGIRAANGDGYLICLGDQPMITLATYELLMMRFNQVVSLNPACIILPYFEGKKGNPVLFSAAYREDLLAHLDSEGCREIVESHRENVQAVSVSDGGVVEDIDTPQDYENLS